MCKSLVNTADTYLVEQFTNGIRFTSEGVLNQSVLLGEESKCMYENVIPNIILQRLLRCSSTVSINIHGGTFSSEGVVCQFHFR